MDSEVKRYLSEIRNKGATITSDSFDNTTDSLEGISDELGQTANAAVTPDGTTGTAHAKLRGLGTRWVGAETSATFTQTNAMGTTENDIATISKINRYKVSVYLDLNTLVAAAEGGTVTVRFYNRIDEATFRIVALATFVVGTTTVHPSVEVNMIKDQTKFSIQCSSAVSVNRAIPYYYLTQDME